ncbi:MAG: hypothetical protein U9N85_14400, partial [Bacteroidota bacterium]|nr:hypothetical protein [Bacteroidota bacterium]
PVDFYYRDTVVRRTVLMDEQEEEYSFSFDNKPEFVKFDAENSLLCEKNEARTKQDYIFILKNVKKYSDIQEAIEQLGKHKGEEEVSYAFSELLNSSYTPFRMAALENIEFGKESEHYADYVKALELLSNNDKNEELRHKAQEILNKTESN